ncbi:hypothetical protein [Lambdina fiscellaria nucleopolyhedrovirus]|uniref:Uncharacterized protein n=1 Tax=Lambdina fiscellaria nucleopolyhedrovirus TaxID=1642929 RepID=A0A0E3Z7G1_9ABAC|nr:hypothetical protein [Lambdina fiscellaria nucleopolyhedrovirus]AKC91711.1 hypothetical protein [Lambdina fiscellaria nucleopolyhedrovirus]
MRRRHKNKTLNMHSSYIRATFTHAHFTITSISKATCAYCLVTKGSNLDWRLKATNLRCLLLLVFDSVKMTRCGDGDDWQRC